MTASTKDVKIDNIAAFTRLAAPIKNAVKVYQNTFGAIDANGFGKPFEGLSGEVLVGRMIEAENGGTTAAGASFMGLGDTSATPYPKVTFQVGEELLPLQAITGLTSAAQINLDVFLNADDHTFTLTAPATNAQKIGRVVGYSSTGIGDLLVTSFESRGGMGDVDEWLTFVVGAGTNSDLAAAASVLGNAVPAPFHGKIVDCYARNPGVALTGGPVTVTPCIAATPTTGGDMVLTQTLAAKAKVAGSAITAANEFHKGDALDLITSTVTAFTAGGPVQVMVRLRKLPGA